MKLLLTSAGLTNASICQALQDLVGKEFKDTNAVFIPTAANIEKGDMSWLIDNYNQFQNLKLKQFEITDISAVELNIWLPKLQQADVIIFGGGNTFHLMNWLNKSGLTTLLPELLKKRVYVGISAGSMVTCADLILDISQKVLYEDLDQSKNLSGLNFVDFYFLPHLNSDYFQGLREKNIKDATSNYKSKFYCLDDNCALKILDQKVELICEGEYLEIN